MIVFFNLCVSVNVCLLVYFVGGRSVGGSKKKRVVCTRFCLILTSSGSAGTSWCLTWYLTFLRHFGAYVTSAKFILNGSSTQWYAKACLQRIILSTIIICIEKLFKPLQKFEIILETALYQLIHRNYLR